MTEPTAARRVQTQQLTLWTLAKGDDVATARVFTSAISRRVEIRVANETVFTCVVEPTCTAEDLDALVVLARAELTADGWVETHTATPQCAHCGAELLTRQQKYCSRLCTADAQRGMRRARSRRHEAHTDAHP